MAVARGTKGVLILTIVITVAALSVAARLNRLSPRERVAPEGWAALDRHEPERAAAIFERELAQRPNDPILHFGAGAAAYALGRTRTAVSLLRRAVELNPNLADAFVMLGEVAHERGDTDLALRSMEQASALRPRDGRVTDLLDRWRRESSVRSSYLEKSAEHFKILYEGGAQQAIGDRVARVLESEYSRLGRALGSYPRDPVTVILYTNREFHDITRSPSWSSGNYDGQIRIAVGNALASPGELDRLATHELAHAVIASAAQRRIPAWLNEGLATFLESNDTSWTSMALKKGGGVVPLETLARGFGALDESSALAAYAESAIAAEILCHALGSHIGPFLQSVGSGRSVDEALMEFQLQPNAFQAEWRRRVGLQ